MDEKLITDAAEEQKKEKKKILPSVLWGCVLFNVIYFGFEKLLNPCGIYYRTWIEIIAYGILFFVIPALLLGILYGKISDWERKQEEIKLRGTILSVLLACIFSFYFLIASIVALLGSETFLEREVKLKNGILEGSTLGFLAASSERSYNYYTNCFLFFKEKYTDEKNIVSLKLEQLYGEPFVVNGVESCVNEEVGKINVYSASPVSNPDIKFHTFSNTYLRAFTNDYMVQRAAYRAFAYADNHQMMRKITLVKDVNLADAFDREIQVTCQGEADITACAEEVTDMIAYIQEDSFWKQSEHFAEILIQQKGKESVRLKIGQSNNAITYDYVKEKIKSANEDIYNRESTIADNRKSKSATEGEQTTEEPESYAEAYSEGEQEELLLGNETPEEAGRTLYEAVFETTGDTYEATYNAKGNFYAILGEGQEIVDGMQMHTRKTLVYDRESKNGKCQLFVAYMEYTYPDGSSGNTKILNFYAVDKRTGEVIDAHKKNWDEVGSEAYRTATGE